jgi:REP element-mobilizing transposase RayT
MRKSSRVPHEVRPEARGALHVVLRIRRGLPGLRTPRALRRLEGAFRKGKEKPGFALLHYSVQQEHLHLVVETESKATLARGMQGLEIRLAKALNALWQRRKGSVFADRYFALALESIRQIWRTVRYVLSNGRKHGTWTKAGAPDPYSSGRWFLPWRRSDTCRPTRSSPVAEPRSYFCLPFLSIDDVPGPRWQVSVSALD